MEDDRVAKWVYDSACNRAIELAGRNGTLIARLESLQSAVASYLSNPNDFTRETLMFAQINAQRTLVECDPLPRPDAPPKPRFRPRARRSNTVPMTVTLRGEAHTADVEYEWHEAESDVCVAEGALIVAVRLEDGSDITDEIYPSVLRALESQLNSDLREGA